MINVEGVLFSGIQQQKLRVCEACASFLSLYDNDSNSFSFFTFKYVCVYILCFAFKERLADHYSGKLHTGFALIRRKMEQLEVKSR